MKGKKSINESLESTLEKKELEEELKIVSLHIRKRKKDSTRTLFLKEMTKQTKQNTIKKGRRNDRK